MVKIVMLCGLLIFSASCGVKTAPTPYYSLPKIVLSDTQAPISTPTPIPVKIKK
jgi:hypothetical protein